MSTEWERERESARENNIRFFNIEQAFEAKDVNKIVRGGRAALKGTNTENCALRYEYRKRPRGQWNSMGYRLKESPS